MNYAAFCRACGQDADNLESFEKFACVGGIPKYWEFVEAGQDVVALAEALYFDFAPYMEQEPQRILRDEGVAGLNAVAVLEAVGRGAERPSEIAARLGTAQTNLSRLLQQLLDASILTRELPFGESVRSTKKTPIVLMIRRCVSGFGSFRRTRAGGALTRPRKSANSFMITQPRCLKTSAGHGSPVVSGIGSAISNWTWSRQTRMTPNDCSSPR
jgi:hypothetical protein